MSFEVIIDWKFIETWEEFLTIFLSQVQASELHGNSLDAIDDSLVYGGMYGIEPPYVIINKNISDTVEDLLEDQKTLVGIFLEFVATHLGNRVVLEY